MVREPELELILQERMKSRSSSVAVSNVTTGSPVSKTQDATFSQLYPTQFMLIGTDDECLARKRLEGLNGIPRTLHGRILSRYGLSYLGNQHWDVTAEYRDRPQEDITSFSTGGGSQTITQSIQTIAQGDPSVDPNRDIERAINFDGKKVAGTDVVTAKPTLVVIQRMDRELFEAKWPVTSERGSTTPNQFTGLKDGDFTNDEYNNYAQLLVDYTGKVCDDGGWFEAIGPSSYQRREVLLINASGRLLNTDAYEITYELGIQLSQNITLPPSLNNTVIRLQGWDYLWYEYEQKDNADSSRTLPSATYYRQEQIYWERKFVGVIPPFEAYSNALKTCTTVPFLCTGP